MIDFHTHVFPEKIVGKTLDFLSKRCGTRPYTNGTLDGLSVSSDEADISLSIALLAVSIQRVKTIKSSCFN